MRNKVFNSLSLIAFLTFFTVCAHAQFMGADNKKDSDNEVSHSLQESLVKQRIEREKKDYNEMLEKGDEAVKLSGELEKSFAQNNKLSSEDRQKLEHLEKLVKKVRTELGAESDDGDSDDSAPADANVKPDDGKNAFERLQTLTEDFADKLKKTTRFSISVAAVQSSNALLNLVRFLKIKN